MIKDTQTLIIPLFKHGLRAQGGGPNIIFLREYIRDTVRKNREISEQTWVPFFQVIFSCEGRPRTLTCLYISYLFVEFNYGIVSPKISELFNPNPPLISFSNSRVHIYFLTIWSGEWFLFEVNLGYGFNVMRG